MRAQRLLQAGPHWYSESPASPVFCSTVLLLTAPPPPPPPPPPVALFVPKLKYSMFEENLSPLNKLDTITPSSKHTHLTQTYILHTAHKCNEMFYF